MDTRLSRRNILKAAGASLAVMGLPNAIAQSGVTTGLSGAETATDEMQNRTRAQRMQWWHAARFGMFIHFGVYSTIGRHEWVMEDEAWPIGTLHRSRGHLSPRSQLPSRLGEVGEGGGDEVHGDDDETSRRILQL